MIRRVDIDAVWHRIEPASRRLLKQPDLIREACRKDLAQCLDTGEGLIVVTIDHEDDSRKLRVWWANADIRTTDAFERHLPFVETMAKALRCISITFGTSRRGWMRKAVKAGFMIRSEKDGLIEFERVLA